MVYEHLTISEARHHIRHQIAWARTSRHTRMHQGAKERIFHEGRVIENLCMHCTNLILTKVSFDGKEFVRPICNLYFNPEAISEETPLGERLRCEGFTINDSTIKEP
jgi:hypothetical protein